MNHSEIAALPAKSPINFLRVQLLAIEAPYATAKQLAAGYNLQKITAMEAETKQQIVIRLVRGDLHMNDDMVGKHLAFIGNVQGSITKAEHEGQWWVQVDKGVQIQPFTPASEIPQPAPKPAAAAPAPAPAPAPIAAPEPAPAPEPEPELEPEQAATGPVLHSSLVKFARGQVLCRLAAYQEFQAAGFEVSPEALSGVATSLFIQLSQKGLLDAVIEMGYPSTPAKAAPKAAPAAVPKPAAATRPSAAVERPAAVVTPQAAAKPATPAPAPVAAPVAVAPPNEDSVTASLPNKVGGNVANIQRNDSPSSATPEQALAKYEELLKKGEMKDGIMSSYQTTRANLNIPWTGTFEIVKTWAGAKHGMAAVDAVIESMSKAFKGDADKMAKGASCSPYVFMAKVEERAKAAK